MEMEYGAHEFIKEACDIYLNHKFSRKNDSIIIEEIQVLYDKLNTQQKVLAQNFRVYIDEIELEFFDNILMKLEL